MLWIQSKPFVQRVSAGCMGVVTVSRTIVRSLRPLKQQVPVWKSRRKSVVGPPNLVGPLRSLGRPCGRHEVPQHVALPLLHPPPAAQAGGRVHRPGVIRPGQDPREGHAPVGPSPKSPSSPFPDGCILFACPYFSSHFTINNGCLRIFCPMALFCDPPWASHGGGSPVHRVGGDPLFLKRSLNGLSLRRQGNRGFE